MLWYVQYESLGEAYDLRCLDLHCLDLQLAQSMIETFTSEVSNRACFEISAIDESKNVMSHRCLKICPQSSSVDWPLRRNPSLVDASWQCQNGHASRAVCTKLSKSLVELEFHSLTSPNGLDVLIRCANTIQCPIIELFSLWHLVRCNMVPCNWQLRLWSMQYCDFFFNDKRTVLRTESWRAWALDTL